MVKCASIATVVLALVVATGAAQAQDADLAAAVDRAREHRAALRYRDALDEIERAMRLGQAGPAEMAALYRLAGELAAGLDEPSTARRWFAHWLSLEPGARLADDASPKLRDPLEAARVAMAGRSIAMRLTRDGDRVRVTIDDDVLGLVRRVRVGAVEGVPGASFELDEARVDRRHVTDKGRSIESFVPVDVAVGLDENGNVLVEGRVPSGPSSPAGNPTRPLHARWQTWAIATGALAATGGVFAWRTSVAQDDFDRLKTESATFGQTETLRKRGERHALTANITFGAASATALISVVLAVRSRDERVTVTALVAPDHAGLALLGAF